MGKLTKIAGLRMCSFFTRLRPAAGVPVLAYHSVDDSGSYLSTAPRIFQMEMGYLARVGCRGISVSQLLSAAERGEPIPPTSVAITFDDGLRSFRDAAWPILRCFGFSATVFVPTDFVGGESEWFADYSLTPMPSLSWDELRMLRDEGADIQSHGCSHRKLTALGGIDLAAELRQSREKLCAELETEIRHLCYPFGDFNDAVKRAAKDCGYRSGLTTAPGRFQAHDDPYAIRRECLDLVTIADAETADLVMGACVDGSYSTYIKTKLAVYGLLGLRDPAAQSR